MEVRGYQTNPVDEASHVKVAYFLTSSRWIHGPDFLFKNEREWPTNIVESTSISSGDPEVKREATVNTVIINDTFCQQRGTDCNNPADNLLLFMDKVKDFSCVVSPVEKAVAVVESAEGGNNGFCVKQWT